MSRRARIGLLALVLAVGGVLVGANVLGSPPERDAHQSAPPLLLGGPDAPAPRALPGWITFSLNGCSGGLIDLSSAQVHAVSASDPCGRGRTRAGSDRDFPILVGERTLEEDDLVEGLGEDEKLLGVVGLDVTTSGLAAVLVAARGATRLRQVLQIWSESGLERSVELRSVQPESIGVADDFGLTGRLIHLSPGGQELAIVSEPGVSRTTLFNVASGQKTLLPAQLGLAWSPDGRWLATSDGEQVLVYGASRTDHVYALSVEADSIEWTELSETR
ncbi:MAG: hypothetical protein ACR2OD_02095 [Gaiellaceae bacterium]